MLGSWDNDLLLAQSTPISNFSSRKLPKMAQLWVPFIGTSGYFGSFMTF
jgi:hypothetical protein